MIWFTLALFVVSFVLTALLVPKPDIENARAGSLEDVEFPRATENAPIPLVLGKVRMKAPNTIWYGNFRSVPIIERIKVSPFKKIKVIVGYQYYLTLDLALALGPGCSLHEIFIDEESVWSGDSGASKEFTGTINAGSLFGGYKEGGGWVGNFLYYNGDFDQPVNSYVESLVGAGDVPAYRGTAHIVFQDNYIGESPSLRRMAFIMSSYTNELALADGGKVNGDDINPAEALYQIMTDPWRGLDIPVGNIDITSLQVAGETLRLEGNGCSVVVTAETDGKRVIEEILRQIDGVMYQDPATGLIVLDLIREDYVVDDLPVYAEESISEVRSFTRSSWDEVRAQVKVTYKQRGQESEKVAISQDAAVVATIGKLTTNTMSFPFVYDDDLANAIASRERSQISVPLFRATIEFNRNANTLRPGSVFKLSWPEYQIEEIVMRVQRFDLGELTNGRIVAECLQDKFALSDVVFASPEESIWENVTYAPVDIVISDIIQMPRFFNHKLEFPVDETANVNYVPLAAKPSNASSHFNTHVAKTGAGETVVDAIPDREFVFYEGYGTLATAYSREEGFATGIDTTVGLDIENGVGEFENRTSTEIKELFENIIYVDGEWMAFETAIDDSNGEWRLQNVYRGLFGTMPKDHAIGTPVYTVPAEAFGNGFVDDLIEGQEFTVWLSDSASGQRQIPSESISQAFTIVDNILDKPLRPTNLLLDGSRAIDPKIEIADQVDRTLTWNLRSQEALTVLDEDDASVAPPGNISYKIDVLVGGVREANLSGTAAAGATSFVIPFSTTTINSTDVEIRVWAVDDDTLEESADYAFLPIELAQNLPPQPARYWRILITDNSGNASFVGAAEIEMLEFTDGYDVTSFGTPSANDEDPDFTAPQAIDDRANTLWRTDGATIAGSWFKVDFGPSLSPAIARVCITARNDGFENQTIRNFTLQSSADDIVWTNILEVTGETNYSSGEKRCFSHPLAPSFTGPIVAGASQNIVLGKISDGVTMQQSTTNIVLNRKVDDMQVQGSTVNIVVEP